MSPLRSPSRHQGAFDEESEFGASCVCRISCPRVPPDRTNSEGLWGVGKSEGLAGLEGQEVVVKCQFSVDKNEIRVLSVKTAQGEVK
jgi:hypothetical protein